MDRELGWAEGLGFNTVRVFFHDLVWERPIRVASRSAWTRFSGVLPEAFASAPSSRFSRTGATYTVSTAR
jgi:hypothetical protein